MVVDVSVETNLIILLQSCTSCFARPGPVPRNCLKQIVSVFHAAMFKVFFKFLGGIYCVHPSMTMQVSQVEKPVKFFVEVVTCTKGVKPYPIRGGRGVSIGGSHDLPVHPGEDSEKRNLCRINYSLYSPLLLIQGDSVGKMTVLVTVRKKIQYEHVSNSEWSPR